MKVFQRFGSVPFSVGETRTESEIEESTVWQRLKETSILQFNSSINGVRISPVAPYAVVALSGLSAPWIGGRTHEHAFSFAKTKTPFSAVDFRRDGVLIALGREDGAVDVYPTADHQTLLRRFKLNAGTVFAVRFSPFENEIVAGTANGDLHIIDISQRREIVHVHAHDDAVADVRPLEAGNCWVSVGKDGAMKFWDFSREGDKLIRAGYSGEAPFSHLVIRGNRLFASAGESVVVVDFQPSISFVGRFTLHTRPIVGMAIVRSNLVTASSDRSIKIIDPSTFAVLYTVKVHSDITSFDAKSDASAYVVGLTGGVVQIKYAKEEEVKQLKKEEVSLPENFRLFNQIERRKDEPWNRELKKFNVADALDKALETGEAPIVAGMIDELDRLGRLDTAIAGRDPQGLIPLLTFLIENTTNPVWSHVILKAIMSVEKIYRFVIADNPQIGKIFEQLVLTINEEMKVQVRASELIGKIDLILDNN